MQPIRSQSGIQLTLQNPDSPGQPSADARLSAALNRTLSAADTKGIQERRQQLMTLFNSLPPADAKALSDKLQSGGHPLSKLFAQKLHHATRGELLGILQKKIHPRARQAGTARIAERVVRTLRNGASPRTPGGGSSNELRMDGGPRDPGSAGQIDSVFVSRDSKRTAGGGGRNEIRLGPGEGRQSLSKDLDLTTAADRKKHLAHHIVGMNATHSITLGSSIRVGALEEVGADEGAPLAGLSGT